MTSRRWRWVSARGSADQPWLTALNQLHHTSGVRKASRAGSQTACLIKAGTFEYLAVPSITGRTRDLRVLGVESSVCWIYGWTRRRCQRVLALMCMCGEACEYQGFCAPHAVAARCTHAVWRVSLSSPSEGEDVRQFYSVENVMTRSMFAYSRTARSAESICAGRRHGGADLSQNGVRIPVTTYQRWIAGFVRSKCNP
jgi:hypothetical protein